LERAHRLEADEKDDWGVTLHNSTSKEAKQYFEISRRIWSTTQKTLDICVRAQAQLNNRKKQQKTKMKWRHMTLHYQHCGEWYAGCVHTTAPRQSTDKFDDTTTGRMSKPCDVIYMCGRECALLYV
jgi:hypothetical protein